MNKAVKLLAATLLLLLAAFSTPPHAEASCSTDQCWAEYDLCVSDCSAFGNPPIPIGGCSHSWSGGPWSCQQCCYSKQQNCSYCMLYGNSAHDPRCGYLYCP